MRSYTPQQAQLEATELQNELAAQGICSIQIDTCRAQDGFFFVNADLLTLYRLKATIRHSAFTDWSTALRIPIESVMKQVSAGTLSVPASVALPASVQQPSYPSLLREGSSAFMYEC